MKLKLSVIALVCFSFAGAAQANEHVSFLLNWVAGGDHAPYYYAQKMGWYKDAGIDLTLLQGKGSMVAAQAAGAGINTFGLADMTTVLVAIGKGADEVAVMNVYANYPGGFYWLKSSGIKSVKDLAGKKIGNPPGDAARSLWPALAKANGIDPNSVTWVNVGPGRKAGGAQGWLGRCGDRVLQRASHLQGATRQRHGLSRPGRMPASIPTAIRSSSTAPFSKRTATRSPLLSK